MKPENEHLEPAIDPETGELILEDPDGELLEGLVEDEIEQLIEERDRLIGERDQLRDDATREHDQKLRTMAEFQNFRKRAIADKLESQKYATVEMTRDLLPILDNFERTILSIDAGANLESIAEGVKMVERQLKNVLELRGVKRIPSVGHPFDPTFHDALSHDPATEEAPPGTVTAEIEAGYLMADRVIRPARVKVAE